MTLQQAARPASITDAFPESCVIHLDAARHATLPWHRPKAEPAANSEPATPGVGHNGPPVPATASAWRDAEPADRLAHALTAQEFAASGNRLRKASVAVLIAVARWSRKKEIPAKQAVFIVDSFAAAASGQSTLSAARLGRILGIHPNTVTKARLALVDDGLIRREVGPNMAPVSPVVSRLKQLADADFHDLFNDWEPASDNKGGRPRKTTSQSTDCEATPKTTSHSRECEVQKTTSHSEANHLTPDPSELGLNPGSATHRSLRRREEEEDKTYSSSPVNGLHNENLPAVVPGHGELIQYAGGMLASGLSAEVVEIAKGLTATVLAGTDLSRLSNPRAYAIKIFGAKLSEAIRLNNEQKLATVKLDAEQQAQSKKLAALDNSIAAGKARRESGGQLPAWRAEINDKLARMRAANRDEPTRFPENTGILRKVRDVVLQNVDGNRILDQVPGATKEQVLAALIEVEEAMSKRGPGGYRPSSSVLQTATSIVAKAVAFLRGEDPPPAEPFRPSRW